MRKEVGKKSNMSFTAAVGDTLEERTSETSNAGKAEETAKAKVAVVKKTSKTQKKDPKKEVSSAERGCKEGFTRHTYVLPSEKVEKIKNIASYFGWTESGTIDQLLEKGIRDAVKKYGDAVVKPAQKKTLF